MSYLSLMIVVTERKNENSVAIRDGNLQLSSRTYVSSHKEYII